jgi:hypothetical protein
MKTLLFVLLLTFATPAFAQNAPGGGAPGTSGAPGSGAPGTVTTLGPAPGTTLTPAPAPGGTPNYGSVYK